MPWLAGDLQFSGEAARWFDDLDSVEATYWDGTTLAPCHLLGWFDGTTVQPAHILGWWDGSVIQPIHKMAM